MANKNRPLLSSTFVGGLVRGLAAPALIVAGPSERPVQRVNIVEVPARGSVSEQLAADGARVIRALEVAAARSE